MSIRARIAIYGGATTLLTLLVFGIVLHALFQVGLRNDQDRVLRDSAEQAVASLQTAPAAELAPHNVLVPIDLRTAGKGTSSDTFVEVLNRDGTTILSSGLIDGAPPEIDGATLETAASAGHARATVNPNNIGLRVYVLLWNRDDLGRDGYVVAGQATSRIDRQLRSFRRLLIITSLLVLAGAFIATWRVAGRSLRPLGVVAGTVDDIGQTQDLSRRLPPVHTGDDIDRLTVSFNRMLGQLEESQARLTSSLEAQQRFVADASHELRSPLTSIRSNAGFLLAHPNVQLQDQIAALEDVVAESERMSRLVDDLLTLARGDAGFKTAKVSLDLAALVRDVHRQAQHLHATRDISLVELADEPAITVPGNADALKQLLWILIDNAVKQTVRGGRIQVELQVDERAAIASIVVRDDGTGIPEVDLPRVFERFYQADRARSSGGAGLGLSIACWIVEDHSGRIRAENNPGGGASFTIDLPLSMPIESAASTL
jgi:signal transduction histidine kinase